MNHENPRRTDSLEVHEAEDGLVVYDPQRDMVHHLNPTAATIFDLCDGTRDPAAIADVLAQAYGLDAPPLEETTTGLRDLVDRRLIRWAGHGTEG